MFMLVAHAQEVVKPVVEAVAAAQPVVEAVAPVVQDVSMMELLSVFFQSFNGLKGAGALGASAIVVQLLIKLLGSPLAKHFFKNQSGGIKLLIAASLSVVGGLVSLLVAGVALPAALVHGSTMAAYSVLAHQVYKQFFQKKIEGEK